MEDIIFGQWTDITRMCQLATERTALPFDGYVEVNRVGVDIKIKGIIRYSDILETAEQDEQLRLYIPPHIATDSPLARGICDLYAGTSSAVKGHYLGQFAVSEGSLGPFLLFLVPSLNSGRAQSVTLSRPVKWETGDYLYFQGEWKA